MIKQFTKLLCGLVLLIISGATKAQVNAYTFAASSGTYTDITGGTPVATSTSAADFLDDTRTSVSIPIGFSFTFNGIAYTNVVAASDGFLSFNTAATSTFTNNLATSTAARRPLVAPLWDDLDGASGTGAANYITTGATGSRIFTIEWKNWQWNYDAMGATISFQVKLYEGTNKIDFIYRQEAGVVNSASASIGIAGVATGAGNYLSLNNSSAAPTVSSTTETTSISTKPATGQVYTFTPPVPCTGTPVGGSAISSYSDVCSGSQFLLSVNGSTTGATGLTYQWQSSADNTAWTDIATATGTTYIATQTTATYYRRITICSGTTGSSSPVLVGMSGPATIPYSENFDGIVAPALPNCVIVENVNASNTWTTAAVTFTGSTAPNVMRYSYNSTVAADDWFFTRGVSLNAGTSYDIKFKYAGTSYPERLEVRVGSAATSVSALAGPQLFNNTNILAVGDGVGTFVPTSSGVYYFGFHVYSTANQNSLYVDDININVTPACPVPTGVAVGAITATSASVSFTSTGSNFIIEYGATGFTPGTGAAAGTGGTVVTGTGSPIVLTGLSAVTTYQVYVRQNCTAGANGYSTNSAVVSFTTPALPPANDNASGAITLTVGAGCTGAPYTNVAATLNTGEPYPSCSGVAQTPVWFKFVAPASGAVRVSTDLGTAPTFVDSKVGLFSATDPANYSTFSIISCDDDGGSAVGSGFLSVLYATGLTAGTTYYVAVDKYTSTTTNGTFCIAVDELSNNMLSLTNTCARPYQTPVNNLNTTYTGWSPLLDSSSLLIALVRNPAGGSVGAYTVSQNVNTGAVRQANGTYYLNRNYRISNTTATNVDVQFFFLNTELAALAAVDPAITLANLGVTRQNNGTATTCYNDLNLSVGALSFIPQTGNGTAGGTSWISFTTPAFSNFYLNRTGTVLPITLTYLKGMKAGTGNALNWKVNCTSVSITMELERSSDTKNFKAITSITASQARCGQPFDYVDASPLKGTNYYRLKMIDVDGKVSYSPIVAIINGTSGAELVGIYPTVVRDEAFLSVAASRNTKMQINITDMSGRVIKTISQTVANGSTLVNINTAALSAGVYNITGMLDGVQTKTLRFVKQ